MAKKVISKNQGFTLIEITVVLAVLMILVAILIPTIGGFIDDSRHLKARRDMEVIALTLTRFKADQGLLCIKRVSATACTKANRVDLLESNGPDVVSADVLSADFSNSEIASGSINWDDDGTTTASMRDQFVLNTPLYPTPRENSLNHPGSFNVPGWRGTYVNNPLGPDPWGKKYLVNTVFTSVAIDASAGTNEGQKSGGWSYDIFIISAGPNGIYETPFGQMNATASGDDIIYVVTGDTR